MAPIETNKRRGIRLDPSAPIHISKGGGADQSNYE